MIKEDHTSDYLIINTAENTTLDLNLTDYYYLENFAHPNVL